MKESDRKLLRLDELNTLKSLVVSNPTEQEEEDIIDELLDFLLLAYADGKIATETDMKKSAKEVTTERINEILYKRFDGLTFEDRAREHIKNGDVDAIGRLAETERHRIYNQVAFDTAKELGATKKTWHCMMLPTSRDTHVYLDGMKKGMSDEFYTFKGNSTQYPGQFGIAEEDINCLCYLTYK